MKVSIVVLTYNRVKRLQNCLDSIRNGTVCKEREIIVVDNASTDGTGGFLDSFEDLRVIRVPTNEGVIARNRAIKVATGEVIAQIDDDVTVRKGWDTEILPYFDDPKIGAVGVQGGVIEGDFGLSVWKTNNGYVDFLTGFFWCFRNCGLMYDPYFAKFWHEELDLSLQFKQKGYKLFMHPNKAVCCHGSMRGNQVDWDLHNRNFGYAKNKWTPILKDLNLEVWK